MNTPVYFISDVHLKLSVDENEKHRRKKFFQVLDKINDTGGSCFFVGDLFDFYYEYTHLAPKAFVDFYTKAMTLKKNGVKLYFLAGNHDYWVGSLIKEKIMDEVHLGDVQLNIHGKRFFITHGDGLLSWDHGYRFLKKVTRSRPFIWLFQLLHPTISYIIASHISKNGRKKERSIKSKDKITKELEGIAKKHFKNGFDYMISGHYHLGEVIPIDEGKLLVLGDWFSKPSYAIFDGEDLILKVLCEDD